MSMAADGVPSADYARTKQKDRLMIFAVAVVIVVAVCVITWDLTRTIPFEGHPVFIIGMRIEKIPDGNWTLVVTGGSFSVNKMNVVVVNQSTDVKTVNSRLSLIETADFKFDDNDGDGKINFKDTITLKASSPNIQSGDYIQLFYDKTLNWERPLP
jgi:hypothetical protein